MTHIPRALHPVCCAGEAAWNPPGLPRLWYQNFGVIEALVKPVLVPTAFQRSISYPIFRPTVNILYVFFRARTHVGRNGYIKLDSPCGFDFGHQEMYPNDVKKCHPSPLPRQYYDYVDNDQSVDQVCLSSDILSPTHQVLIMHASPPNTLHAHNPSMHRHTRPPHTT